MIKNSLPLRLLAVIVLVVLFGQYVPHSALRFFYTFSLVFKEILSLILPAMVFSFVFAGIISFKKNAPAILSIMLGVILLSNTLTAVLAYFATKLSLPYLASHEDSIAAVSDINFLQPLFNFSLPFSVRAEKALLLALFMGFLLSYFPMPALEKSFLRLKAIITTILNKVFIPLLPLYILGFILEMNYKGITSAIFADFSKTFCLILTMQAFMISLLYIVAANFSLSKALTYMKNAFPSYITALSTMSSAITIPVTVKSAEKNIGKRALVNLAVPIMANVHLVGAALGTPILALVTMKLFLGYIPDFAHYMHFVGYFVITMLAASGVPSGGIIVMIPLLQSILGFNQEMISIMTALYLLQEAFGTAANVMGDGALIIIVDKLLQRLGLLKPEPIKEA